MTIEQAEQLKRDLTDKFVVVSGEAPELRRFSGLTGRVKTTLLRGRTVYDDGQVVGPAEGRYLPRPGPR